MGSDRVRTAAEMELLTPDERARVIEDGFVDSLDALNPEFRQRVERTATRIATEQGLLDAEPS